MKKLFVLISALSYFISAFGQQNLDELTKPIVAEGKLLYKSEMASWYGTDLFLERYKDQEKIGGYFSFNEGDTTKCVIFSNDVEPVVIGTILFDNTFNVETAKYDVTKRNFTLNELDLFTIRNNALEIINSDTIFKTYNNTNLNLIPVISNGEKKVYVLTGPQQNGVVIFGNDYLLTFDSENNLMNRKQLHKNIIPIYYESEELKGKIVTEAIHSHLPETGDFITATDICTLMLYEKFAKWKQHTVISAKYVSIWNCETDELLVVKREAFDKMSNDKTKKKKRKN